MHAGALGIATRLSDWFAKQSVDPMWPVFPMTNLRGQFIKCVSNLTTVQTITASGNCARLSLEKHRSGSTVRARVSSESLNVPAST